MRSSSPLTSWTGRDGDVTVERGSAKLSPPLLRATPEMVLSRSIGNRLLPHRSAPTLDGQVADLSTATGFLVYGDPVAWRATTGTRTERIAALGASGHLIVFESAGQERHIVDAPHTPVAADNVQHKRNLRRKVRTIRWDPHKPNIPRARRRRRCSAPSTASGYGRSPR